MVRRHLSRLLRNAGRIRAEADEEIDFHLERRIAELEQRGLSQAEAREEALRLFGDVEGTRAALIESDLRRERRVRRKEYFQEFRQDLSHGARQLRRRPAFAAIAILTLAVGIGANTAVFSAADHVVLRPLPYAEADRVVTLWETDAQSGDRFREVSPGNFIDWSERSMSFAATGLAEPYSFDLTGDGPPESLPAWLVTEGFFEALGVRPVVGRSFEPHEHQPNAELVVMMSHRMWTQRFGADPSLVGGTIQIESQAARVVGVLPSWLDYPSSADLWGPKYFREDEPQDRHSDYMRAVGRLRPGVTLSAAQADLDRVAATLASEHPETNRDAGVNVVPLRETILGDVRPALMVLLGAVGFLLLIACANVASLLLARGLERGRELGVRAALGAGRARLVRQLVSESVLIAALGGAAGLLLAWLGVEVFTALSPPELPRAENIAIDARVLGFALATTLLTALLFGLVPALRFSRPDLLSAVRAESRSSTASGERIRLQGLLVIGEIALALIMVTGAGLLVRSFVDLLGNDLGFDVEKRATLQVFVYDEIETWQQRLDRVTEFEERLASVPGVTGVGIVSALPFHPSQIDARDKLAIVGRPQRPEEQPEVLTNIASPDYFRVMGVPLLAGRSFTERDRPGAPRVAIINETLARRYFAGEDPIGQRIFIGAMSRPAEREIVGVVGDVRPTSFDSEPQPELYVPYAQRVPGGVTFVVLTESDAARLLPSLREAIWDVYARQAIYHSGTVEELVSESLVERRFHLTLLASFSAVALLLAAIGIYGLVSFSTRQRTSEIGVRIALGASPGEVVSMIVRQSFRLVLPGIALGLLGALLLTRFMENMLYGVTPTDLPTFVQITLLMLLISSAAAYLPARRAAAADPVAALRDMR